MTHEINHASRFERRVLRIGVLGVWPIGQKKLRALFQMPCVDARVPNKRSPCENSEAWVSRAVSRVQRRFKSKSLEQHAPRIGTVASIVNVTEEAIAGSNLGRESKCNARRRKDSCSLHILLYSASVSSTFKMS